MTDLEIIGKQSLSVFGAKRLAYCADPKKFIHLSDAGGPLAEAYKKDLSFASFCENCYWLIVVPPGPKVVGQVAFTDNKAVQFSCSKGLALLERILAWSKRTLIPPLVFPAKLSSADFSKFQELAADESFQEYFSIDVINELFGLGLLPIGLRVENDRLIVRALGLSTELPIRSASFSLSGSSLRCNNRLLIGDKSVSGFTIDFPTPKVAARYLELIGISPVLGGAQQVVLSDADTLVGLVGQVRVEGNLRGRTLERMARDARIETNTLRIFDKTGAEIFSVDFESPTVAIDGTAEAFIVSLDSSVALRITSESKPFAHAIYTNDAVHAAVLRSSDVGPFTARYPEGRFIRIEPTGDGATIGYVGGELTAVPAGVEQPILRTTNSKSILQVGDYLCRRNCPCLKASVVC